MAEDERAEGEEVAGGDDAAAAAGTGGGGAGAGAAEAALAAAVERDGEGEAEGEGAEGEEAAAVARKRFGAVGADDAPLAASAVGRGAGCRRTGHGMP